MLRTALLTIAKVILCLLGPGFIYYGYRLLRAAGPLREPTPLILRELDRVTADQLDSEANASTDLDDIAYRRMAASEMRTFTDNEERWNKFLSNLYSFCGGVLIVIGIVALYAWWHFFLGPLFGDPFLLQGIVMEPHARPSQ